MKDDDGTSYLSGEASSSLPSILKSIRITGVERENESKPRIEVIEETNQCDDDDDDDDDPPPLFGVDASRSTSVPLKQGHGSEVSLMEQMMKEALDTKVVLDKEKEIQRKKDIQSSSFGLQKGFLNKKQKTKKRDIVVVPSITKGSHTNSLQLPEVQEAMSASSSTLLHRTIQNELTSPDLLNRIQQNPKLLRGMKDPLCLAALDALQRNPKDALEKFREYPNVLEFMNEMFSLLGDHFHQLGETTDARTSDLQASRSEKEVNKHNMSVDDVIQDKELTSLLMDQDMQRIMHECSSAPIMTKKYMADPLYGPKLQRLLDAGLLQLVQ
jgi:hypothetical protein